MSRLIRYVFFALAVACPAVIQASEIIPDEAARQHGLTRAWFNQVQVDRATGRVADVLVDEGMVFVQTNQAMLHALDAATGRSLWVASIGERGHPGVAPGANSRMVATVSGSTLVVLNRYNGKVLWKTKLESAPATSPALSEDRAYLPLTNGMLMSFRLKELADAAKDLGVAEKAATTAEEKAAHETQRHEALSLDQRHIPPLAYQSPGRALAPPIVTRQTADEECIAWTTEKGYLLAAKINRTDEKSIDLRYRMETGGPIAAPPIYLQPATGRSNDSGTIIVASEDGFVHAIRERDGKRLWRFSTGSPVIRPLAAVAQVVLVPNQLGGLSCLNARTGDQLWSAPDVTQILAESKERIYATDKRDRLLVLDLRTGKLIDTIPAGEMLQVKAMNNFSDRLVLATKSGLIQCLHEVELSDPVVHHARPKAVTAAIAKKPAMPQAEKKHEPSSSAPSSVASSGGGGGGSSAKKKTKPPTAGDTFGSAAGKKPKRGAAQPPGSEMMPMGEGNVPAGRAKVPGRRARNAGGANP